MSGVPCYLPVILASVAGMRHKISAARHVHHERNCGLLQDRECDCTPRIEVERLNGDVETLRGELRQWQTTEGDKAE